MPSRHPVAALAATAGLLLALAMGCGREDDSPEAQVRRVIGAVEEAAEAGDVSAIRGHVSARYQDEAGHDKRALLAFLTYQVMRRGQRHVLVRIHDVVPRSEADGEWRLVWAQWWPTDPSDLL